VQDAHYFRVRAELYFELARMMSVRQDAEYCRITAERLTAKAADLERHPSPISAPTISTNQGC
jgi:hypothetical protein